MSEGTEPDKAADKGPSAGQAVLGYNPLNPRSAGEHFANQRADQMAQQLGFGSYQEAVNSPMAAREPRGSR